VGPFVFLVCKPRLQKFGMTPWTGDGIISTLVLKQDNIKKINCSRYGLHEANINWFKSRQSLRTQKSKFTC
jgi:hypothetical protein